MMTIVLKGPCNIIDLLLQCEKTPLDLENERQRGMLVDRVGAMIRSKCVPKIYVFGHAFRVRDAFCKIQPGVAHGKLDFSVLAKADWGTFWKVLYKSSWKCAREIYRAIPLFLPM